MSRADPSISDARSYLLRTALCREPRSPEEVMRFVTQTSFALVLSVISTAALATASVPASPIAGGHDNQASCAAAGKQVSAALESNPNDAARQEKKMGLEFCNDGYYHQGMVHYARAMELLGVKS
jgi:hypothetical protein